MSSGRPLIPATPVHPSATIRDELEARGWSVSELARRGRCSRTNLGLVMKGARVTPTVARALSRAFGTSEAFWLRYQLLFELDTRYHVTRDWAERFKIARGTKRPRNVSPGIWRAQLAACRGQRRELLMQLRDLERQIADVQAGRLAT